MKPPRRYVDANGVGATGASALGFGGPSDWETLAGDVDEVDDLELYATKQDPPKTADEKKDESSSAPVELPAGSPVAAQGNAPWKDPGVGGIVEAGHSAPVELGGGVIMPQAQAGAPIDSGIIMSAEPITAPPISAVPGHGWQQGAQEPVQHPPVHSQQSPSHPPAPQNTGLPSPQPNSFVITEDSGWGAPPVPPSKPLNLASKPVHPPHPSNQQPHPVMPTANEGMIVQGGWVQAQNVHPETIIHSSPPPAGPYMNNASAHIQGHPAQERNPSALPTQPTHAPPGPSVEEHKVMQTKLAQAESELAQFKEKAVHQRLMGEQSTEEVAALKDKIARLETENKSALAEVASLERSLERAENASATAANEKASWEKERANFQMRLSEFEAMLNSVRAENETGKSDLNTKLIAAEAALITARSEVETMKNTHETKLKESETALNQKTIEMSALQKQVEEHKSQAADIAPGLDPWFKGSLERYRDALFKEAAAIPVQDKMKTFQDFVNAEAGLRGIILQFGSKGEPKGFEPIPAPQAPAPAPVVESNAPPKQEIAKPVRPTVSIQQVEPAYDDAEYSPGGRPILNRPPPVKAVSEPVVPQTLNDRTKQPSAPVTPPEPSITPEPTSANNLADFRAFRNNSVPEGPTEAAKEQQQISQKPLPRASLPNTNMKAYTPFKYQPNPGATSQPSSSPATPIDPKSAVQPQLGRSAFSTSQVPTVSSQNKRMSVVKPIEDFLPDVPRQDKKRQSTSSAPITTPEIIPERLKPKTPAPPIPEKIETSKSPAPRKLSPPRQVDTSLPPLESLLDLLPEIRMPAPASSHPKLAPLNADLARLTPADFSFIGPLATTWDAKATTIRRRLESERAQRQADFEENPSDLFHEGEINYSDISEMEAEWKRREAESQERESADEWASYMKEVFEPVYGRLQGEIAEIADINSRVEELVAAAVSGTRALGPEAHADIGEFVPLVDALDFLVRVHGALDERKREAGRAVAERDRRYKKNVAGTLWRKGQVSEMKRVEAAMDKSERKADLGRRSENWEILKALYKIVKAGVKRGVDENERGVEELLKAVVRLGNEAAGIDDEAFVRASLRRTKDVLKDLGDSSLRLMRLYETVDNALNEAEFDAQLASEKAKDAPPDVFEDLNFQKQEQDKLLKEEALKRENGIDQAMQGWQREVDGVMERFADGGKGSADSPPRATAGDDEEAERKRRQKAALEAAKRRNGEL
jgi:hypothetical protein